MIALAAGDVLDFWFVQSSPKQWFSKDAEFDAKILDQFGALHQKAARCELFEWRATADGRLAEIIVLDQFSRNIYRDRGAAFATDPLALALAQEAVNGGFDELIDESRRHFLYMPYMHSESLMIHDEALGLFEKAGNESALEFERRHRVIIERFGRYPHRNAVLGRKSTAEELSFLSESGSGF